jgi:hypothetical protein
MFASGLLNFLRCCVSRSEVRASPKSFLPVFQLKIYLDIT